MVTRLLWWCLVLFQTRPALGAEPTVLDIDINIPDKNNGNHNYYKDLAPDPSRTYVAVYSVGASTEPHTLEYLSTFHADSAGVFHVSLPQPDNSTFAAYQLNFQSLDVHFAVSSQFRVHVAPDGVTVQQHLPGLHDALQPRLPSMSAAVQAPSHYSALLDGSVFHITLSQYLQQDAAGLAASVVRSIPFLSTILGHRWMTIGFVSIIIVALLPAVITRLDPDFADRLVEAQQQAQQQAQQ